MGLLICFLIMQNSKDLTRTPEEHRIKRTKLAGKLDNSTDWSLATSLTNAGHKSLMGLSKIASETELTENLNLFFFF